MLRFGTETDRNFATDRSALGDIQRSLYVSSRLSRSFVSPSAVRRPEMYNGVINIIIPSRRVTPCSVLQVSFLPHVSCCSSIAIRPTLYTKCCGSMKTLFISSELKFQIVGFLHGAWFHIHGNGILFIGESGSMNQPADHTLPC